MLLGNSLAVCLCIMREIFCYVLQAYNAKTAELPGGVLPYETDGDARRLA